MTHGGPPRIPAQPGAQSVFARTEWTVTHSAEATQFLRLVVSKSKVSYLDSDADADTEHHILPLG